MKRFRVIIEVDHDGILRENFNAIALRHAATFPTGAVVYVATEEKEVHHGRPVYRDNHILARI